MYEQKHPMATVPNHSLVSDNETVLLCHVLARNARISIIHSFIHKWLIKNSHRSPETELQQFYKNRINAALA